MKLRLGTRKSLLAQTQSRWVADQLKRSFPDLDIEFVLITTSGDEGNRRPEESGGLKALFTKEIEEALLDRRIDLAVHSMKDMPADLPAGLVIGAVPKREDPRDVWIAKDGRPFREAKTGAKIGTGAVRRQAQIRRIRPDLDLVPLRGNVDTRLRKLQGGEFDGIILALAGLKRLGRDREATEILPSDLLLPAVGQGALAIEIRENDKAMLPYMRTLDDMATHYAALAERAFLKILGGSCQTPIAALAEVSGSQLKMQGLVASVDGQRWIRDQLTGVASDAAGVGENLGKRLLAAGAGHLLS